MHLIILVLGLLQTWSIWMQMTFFLFCSIFLGYSFFFYLSRSCFLYHFFLGCPFLVVLIWSFFLYLTLYISPFLVYFPSLSFFVYCAIGQGESREGKGVPPLLRRIQTAISSLPIVRFSPDLQVMKANSKVTHRCFGSKLHQSTSSRCSVKSKLWQYIYLYIYIYICIY